MAVAETRLRVVLVDEATAQLLKMNKAMSSLSSSLLGANTSGYTKQLDNLNSSVDRIDKSIKSFGKSLKTLTVAYNTLSTVGNMLGNVFGGTYEYYKDFQSNAVGIAGILSSMTTLNGKTLEWNDSMAMSKSIMAKLRVEALQTSATSKDLIETFRGILGPGLSQGMKVDEILQFSKVGVNAVRSLGLPPNQYLQELRSILQGNIRASSSTLATALGITNEQVKEAKNNAGGVFKFLMDRMKGFVQSTTETSKTLTGQLAILEEAYKTIGAQAYENIFNSFSKTIESVNKALLVKNKDGLFEINDDVVDKITNVANIVDTALNKAMNNVKWIVDNISTVGLGLGAFLVLPKALEQAKNVLTNIVGVVNSVKTGLLSYDIQKEQQLAQLKRDQVKVHTDILNKLQNEVSAKNNLVKLEKNVEKAKNGEALVVEKIIRLEEILTKAEIERDEVCRRILDFERQILKVKDEQTRKQLADNYIKELSYIHQQNNEAMKRGKEITESYAGKMQYFANGVSEVCGKLGEMTHGLTASAFAVKLFTDEEDGAINQMANFVIYADMVVTAIGGISQALSVACGWLKTFTKWQAVAMAFKGFGAVGGATIGLLFGGATAGAFAMKEGLSLEDMWNRWTVNPNDIDYKQKKALEEYNKAKAENPDHYYDLDTGLNQGERPAGNRYNELINAFPGGGSAGGKGGKGKTAEEITASYNKLIESIKSSKENAIDFGNAYKKAMAGANKQVSTWEESLVKIKKSGLLTEDDIKQAETLMNEYTELMKQKATEAERTEKLGVLKSKIGQADNVMLFGGSQEEQYKRKDEALQNYRAYLSLILDDTNLNTQQRIAYEQQYADAVKQIRQNDMTNFSTAWKATLQELSQQQIDYSEGIRTIYSEFTNFGQNLIGSTKSVTEQLRDLCQNLTKDILNMMMKIYMQGLMMNLIGNIFGGGLKAPANVKTNTPLADFNIHNISAMDMDASNLAFLNGSRASGGTVGNGWYLVGEKGPELVNFSNPGRVYTADQTAKALSNNGGGVNIKIDLHNESGQQMQAETTGSSFDGESYVVGVVLKAISTNKNGMRNIIKGVATT